jgi:flavin-dependent trigonelline monooxygenase, reductase component
MSSGGFEPRAFRKALGAFATGVTVITTRDNDGTPRGFTANSFTSVSLDPPLILVCVAHSASSSSVFAGAKHFAVTVLSHIQKPVSTLFASKASDKFAQVSWYSRQTGCPVLEGGVAWFDCVRENTIQAGDHFILIGRVVAFGETADQPLGYCRGAYVDFGLSENAISALAQSAQVGAILEHDGHLLLLRGEDGTVALPTGRRLEPKEDPTSLRGKLARLGVDATLDFLFAVFEDTAAANASVSIYYRGSATGIRSDDPVILRVSLDAVPFGQFADPAVRSMIQRFVKERQEDVFGIYVGNSQAGTVQSLAEIRATPRFTTQEQRS